jgi:hypothetical protein
MHPGRVRHSSPRASGLWRSGAQHIAEIGVKGLWGRVDDSLGLACGSLDGAWRMDADIYGDPDVRLDVHGGLCRRGGRHGLSEAVLRLDVHHEAVVVPCFDDLELVVRGEFGDLE